MVAARAKSSRLKRSLTGGDDRGGFSRCGDEVAKWLVAFVSDQPGVVGKVDTKGVSRGIGAGRVSDGDYSGGEQ